VEERLQKIIARAGVCSRREAEKLIAEGKVTVNGTTVSELGSKADAMNDHIKVDGKLVQPLEKFHYILLYKPKGVVTSVSDPEERPVVLDLIKGVRDRVYPVGRLDFNTEGALLITNDGELANRLLHPKSKCPKTYLVKVSGVPKLKAIKRLERGITIDGTRYGSSKINVLSSDNNTWLEVILTEGKNQQVRKMFEHIGHPVSKLKRIGFGFLTLKGLAPGESRTLTETEVSRMSRGDFKPLMPINPYIFLKEYGVPVEPYKLKPSYRHGMEPRGKRPPGKGQRRGPGRGGFRGKDRSDKRNFRDKRGRQEGKRPPRSGYKVFQPSNTNDRSVYHDPRPIDVVKREAAEKGKDRPGRGKSDEDKD